MKVARRMISVLMLILVTLLVGTPIFAMQTQSGSEITGMDSEQSNTSMQQSMSGSMETSRTETGSVLSGNLENESRDIFQSDEISLPDVSVDSEIAGIISQGTNVTPSNTTQTLLGIVFWVCIVIGILVIVVVIIAATRKSPKGGTGKKRYERRPMTPKGKRILNEKYYRNIKK